MLSPLIQLWRKSGERNKLPSDNDIAHALTFCGNDNLILDRVKNTAYFR